MPDQSVETVDAGKPAAPAWHTLAAKAAAWGVMFAASLFNLLNFNGYPLFRPEVWALLLTLVVIGGGFALIERAAPKLAFLFTATLVMLGADFNTDNTTIPLLLALAALAAAWFNNAATVKLVIAAFGTVALFQLGTGVAGGSAPQTATAKPSPPATNGKPPIIHLLMDSYVGMEGMRAEPALLGLQAKTETMFTSRGFRLYDQAYSRHANTANSVPYMLSLGASKPAERSQVLKRSVPDKFAYFQRLTDEGYHVSVDGVNFIDLCTGQPIAECRQFAHSDLSALTKFPLSTRDRAVTIGITLASFGAVTSNAYDLWQAAKWKWFGQVPVAMRNLKKVGSLRSELAMRDLAKSFAHVENGHAYFVHLLMPHEPYVFDAECNILPRATWSNEQVPGSRAHRLADYAAQLTCTNHLLGKIFEGIDSSPAGKSAVVIVHGDHGSRIVSFRPTVDDPDASLPDFAMTYSALFAIRAPGVEPGVAEGRASLDELLQDFVASDFAKAPPSGVRPAEIILATHDWIPKKRAPLPEYAGR